MTTQLIPIGQQSAAAASNKTPGRSLPRTGTAGRLPSCLQPASGGVGGGRSRYSGARAENGNPCVCPCTPDGKKGLGEERSGCPGASEPWKNPQSPEKRKPGAGQGSRSPGRSCSIGSVRSTFYAKLRSTWEKGFWVSVLSGHFFLFKSAKSNGKYNGRAHVGVIKKQ